VLSIAQIVKQYCPVDPSTSHLSKKLKLTSSTPLEVLMKRYFNKLPFPFWYLLVGATIFSIVVVAQSYFSSILMAEKGNAMKWSVFMAIIPFVNFYFWSLLSPLIFELSQKLDLRKGKVYQGVGIVFLAGLILSVFHEFVTSMAYYIPRMVIIGGRSFSQMFEHLNFKYFTFAISTRLLEFLVILIVFIALNYYKKYASSRIHLEKVKNELQEAQFQALKMQLHPHFLFNTLNSISSLIDEDQLLAQKMVARLGDMLRKILDHGQKTSVTLREELVFIENYLSIEEIRFMDRLKITYEISEEANQVMVPNLILQPLVENSIKHGFANKTGNCQLGIKAKVHDGKLKIEIQDNGNANGGRETNEGVGMNNVKERLEKFYKEKATMSVDRPESGGFNVTIIIELT
jgi:sensor histidine kinase YesM